MILGAPGCLRGSIFDAFSSILLHIPRPLCTAKRGGGVGRSPHGSGASPDASRVEILSRTVQSPSLKGYTGQSNSATVTSRSPAAAHQILHVKIETHFGGFWALQGTLLGRFLDRFRNIFRISVFDHFLDTFFIIFGSILASFFDHFLMFF